MVYCNLISDAKYRISKPLILGVLSEKIGCHGKKEICNFSSVSCQNELKFGTLM